jgi:Uma2 family endonuclease
MSARATRPGPRPKVIPPLENGDQLTSSEFLRRYSAMPASVKAELIEGVVYMASPVSAFHGNPHTDMIGWLYNYRIATPGTDTADNTTIRLDVRNVPQPDAVLYTLASHGGPVRISDDGYIEGAPDLAAEIAQTSASKDLGPKMTAYARNGIAEYIVWRTHDGELDWFVLRSGVYEPLQPDANGVFRSERYPGLWLDGYAMLERDAAKVNTVLQQGLQSPEHARFVADLQARRTG